MKTLFRRARRVILRAASNWVVKTFGLCGVGSPPVESQRGVHGRRELVKVVNQSYAPNPLAVLSPRWKVLAKLSKWKTRQLLIMLVTIWGVRGLQVWEMDFLIEILKVVKFQGVEFATLALIIREKPPLVGESIEHYRQRVRSYNQDAYWLLGFILEAPNSPLRSSHPRRMVSLAKSYKFLLKWICGNNLPATQFRTVEKRRKRGYTDHGSLSSRSRADKQLAEELAYIAYERWPPWRKRLGYSSIEDFLSYVTACGF
jgi:hypothetical protein